MGFGEAHELPDGRLPVHSVDTREQAKALIVATCKLAWDRSGEYIAEDLAAEQTLENLERFALRLQEREKLMKNHPAWKEDHAVRTEGTQR